MWTVACFGDEIGNDPLERGDRLLEEVLELLQSGGYPKERVPLLRHYVWSRDVGEPFQETGGVMVTLAAYCNAHGIDLNEAAEIELSRVWTKAAQIRAKQKAKPTGSALPQACELQQRDHPTRAEIRLAAMGLLACEPAKLQDWANIVAFSDPMHQALNKLAAAGNSCTT